MKRHSFRAASEVRLAAKAASVNDETVHKHQEVYMTKITYEVVEHDGGWAYRVDGVFSETFPSHDMARRAAERAAKEQVVAGNTTGISYEDKDGRWHDEVSAGDDRPETDVEG
jgi:hypothetical protein